MAIQKFANRLLQRYRPIRFLDGSTWKSEPLLGEASMHTAKNLCHAASENQFSVDDIETMKRIAKGGVGVIECM